MFGLSVNTDVRDDDTPSAWRASIRAGPQAGSPARRVPPGERAALAVAQRVHRHAARADDLHAERADAGSAARRSHRPRAADHLDGTDPAGADHRRLPRDSPCDGARHEREGAADDLARPALGASRSGHGTSRGRSGQVGAGRRGVADRGLISPMRTRASSRCPCPPDVPTCPTPSPTNSPTPHPADPGAQLADLELRHCRRTRAEHPTRRWKPKRLFSLAGRLARTNRRTLLHLAGHGAGCVVGAWAVGSAGCGQRAQGCDRVQQESGPGRPWNRRPPERPRPNCSCPSGRITPPRPTPTDLDHHRTRDEDPG